MPGWSLSNTLIFYLKHITVFLLLGMQDSTSVLCFGTIINSHQPKAQKFKNTTLNIPQAGHLFTVWELKQEGRESPFWALCGNVSL